MRFTIVGPPRTKKNSGRRLMRGGRVYSVPSEAAVAWEASAIAQLMRRGRRPPLDGADGNRGMSPLLISIPVSVRALVYRDANRGDLVGYLQAIGDALQGGHGKSKVPCVLVDDVQIKSWDGSRLLIDKVNPRVEIELTPMDAP